VRKALVKMLKVLAGTGSLEGDLIYQLTTEGLRQLKWLREENWREREALVKVLKALAGSPSIERTLVSQLAAEWFEQPKTQEDQIVRKALTRMLAALVGSPSLKGALISPLATEGLKQLKKRASWRDRKPLLRMLTALAGSPSLKGALISPLATEGLKQLKKRPSWHHRKPFVRMLTALAGSPSIERTLVSQLAAEWFELLKWEEDGKVKEALVEMLKVLAGAGSLEGVLISQLATQGFELLKKEKNWKVKVALVEILKVLAGAGSLEGVLISQLATQGFELLKKEKNGKVKEALVEMLKVLVGAGSLEGVLISQLASKGLEQLKKEKNWKVSSTLVEILKALMGSPSVEGALISQLTTEGLEQLKKEEDRVVRKPHVKMLEVLGVLAKISPKEFAKALLTTVEAGVVPRPLLHKLRSTFTFLSPKCLMGIYQEMPEHPLAIAELLMLHAFQTQTAFVISKDMISKKEKLVVYTSQQSEPAVLECDEALSNALFKMRARLLGMPLEKQAPLTADQVDLQYKVGSQATSLQPGVSTCTDPHEPTQQSLHTRQTSARVVGGSLIVPDEGLKYSNIRAAVADRIKRNHPDLNPNTLKIIDLAIEVLEKHPNKCSSVKQAIDWVKQVNTHNTHFMKGYYDAAQNCLNETIQPKLSSSDELEPPDPSIFPSPLATTMESSRFARRFQPSVAEINHEHRDPLDNRRGYF